MSIPIVLQTPQNEEKNPKRNKEGASSSGMDTSNAQYEGNQSKRRMLNPVSEQEGTKGFVEVTKLSLTRAGAQLHLEKHGSHLPHTLKC